MTIIKQESAQSEKTEGKGKQEKEKPLHPKALLQMVTENSLTTSMSDEKINLPTANYSGKIGSSSKTINKAVTDLRPSPVPPKALRSNTIRSERRSKTKSTGRGRIDVPGDNTDHETPSLL